MKNRANTRRKLKKVVVLAMAVSMLGGCAVQTAPETEKGFTKTEQAGDTDTASSDRKSVV